MQFRIKIKETEQEINKGILLAVLPDITKDFNKSVNLIKRELPPLIRSIVLENPTYDSLISGKLKYELGIPDAGVKIARMLQIWTQNIHYKIQPPKLKGSSNIIASFGASMFRADFSEVIETADAKVYDSLRGYELEWLRWLVFYGNIPIIDNFHVEMMNSKRSRTGRALMLSGKSWSVPPEHAGTMADNWITRSIEAKSQEIDKILKKAFS